MFWLFCGIISSVFLKWTFGKNEDGTWDIKDSTVINFIIIGVSFTIAIIQFGIGIKAYPSFAGNLAEIKALEKRIEDIRSSNYKYEKEGSFIAGSVENYQQSTNLSKYIADLASKEASYSKQLKRAKLHKEIFPLYFFGTGWAISDKINTLEIIK